MRFSSPNPTPLSISLLISFPQYTVIVSVTQRATERTRDSKTVEGRDGGGERKTKIEKEKGERKRAKIKKG